MRFAIQLNIFKPVYDARDDMSDLSLSKTGGLFFVMNNFKNAQSNATKILETLATNILFFF